MAFARCGRWVSLPVAVGCYRLVEGWRAALRAGGRAMKRLTQGGCGPLSVYAALGGAWVAAWSWRARALMPSA